MDLFDIAQTIHILSGSIVLLIGIIQLILPKKGLKHKVLGRIYFVLMIVIFITAFPMSVVKQNWFLASVSLFSLHLVLTGFRFARNKKNDQTQHVDKAICIFGMLSGLSLVALTIYFLTAGAGIFAIVPGVFGMILLLNVAHDYKMFILQKPIARYGKMNWFFNHLSRMIASYIAAMTAFLVNVQPFGSNIINWILPTIAGTIFIIAASKFYAKKFNISRAD